MISELLIDDDPEIFEIMSIEFGQDSDFTSQTCNSTEWAPELIKTMKFDTGICDYSMPEMDGYSLIHFLRYGGCDTQLILIQQGS
jgi:DNA-binding response OmpR family regulator